MFSSISSYIWGAESSEETNGAPEASYPPLSTPLRTRSPSPDDWVLVGPSPAPGNLTGALEPLPVSPSSSSGTSTPASSEEDEMEHSEVVAEEEPQIVNRGRPNNPAASVQSLATAELKQVKQSQIQKQRTTGKALSSKALKRTNKALMADQGKKSVSRQNFSIKMAGKNLKQC